MVPYEAEVGGDDFHGPQGKLQVHPLAGNQQKHSSQKTEKLDLMKIYNTCFAEKKVKRVCIMQEKTCQ